MKKVLLCLFAAFFTGMAVSIAQCADGRFRDFVFADYQLTSDVQYGSNVNQDGSAALLKMDVYEPLGDTEIDRPVVIVCHGGYFLGGDKAGVDVVDLCRDLAKMGYVVASINYRIGIPLTMPLEIPYGQAVVRAVQDLRAAIRWFRKDAAENGNTYRVDSNQIYVGGDSAGGFMALHHAYFDDEEIPDWLDMSATGLAGGFEGESGNPGYSSDVNAIYSVSGAIGDMDWIDAGETTPACLFHGDNDQTITIDSGMFVLFNILDVTEIDGSNPINARMNEFEIEHCYHITQDGGHVPYLESAAIYDTTLSILTNFLSHYICGVELDCEYRTITGIQEQTELKLGIYPNPCSAGDIIRIAKSQPMASGMLCDLNGKIIRTFFVKGNEIRIPSDVSPGVYLLKVNDTEVYRILVE